MLALRLYLLPLLIALTLALALGDALSAPEARIGEDQLRRVENRYGSKARARVIAWEQMLNGDRSGGDQAKLERVNAYFNELAFVSDSEHWGRDDYWATPVEFLASGAGDCEDFSVAKYFTLRQLGVPIERLRLVYAKAVKLNEAHMVLAYFPTPQADPLILDNLVPEIRPASRRQDLVPVYSFNGDGLWLAKQRGQGNRVGSSRRLGLWKDLQDRMLEVLPDAH